MRGGLRYRFSNKLSLDLSHKHEAETDYIISAGRDGLGEPRIAFINFKEVTSVFSGIYNFTSRINLTLRIRHYWSPVPVKRIAYLDNNGYPVSPVPSSQIINVNFFNADAFFTWDFRYGSRLVIGYKNGLGNDESELIEGSRYKKYLSNFGQSFNLRHSNELTVRFIYFLDYAKIRRH